MQKEFVHLHVHSEYSLLDGANKIKDLAVAVSKDKQRAIAITDHGNMYGALEHYNTCLEHNVKPIIGCEFYVAKDVCTRKHTRANGYNHLTLLARNHEGYKNLLMLTSMSFIQGLSSRPRIDMELISKYSKGVTCLSGCLSGRINELILDSKEGEALAMVTKLKDIFGSDNFFLEIQRNGLEIQDKATEGMYRIHQKTNIPLVATNDIHYLRHEDCAFQDTLLCINTGARKSDPDRFRFDSDTMYFKNTEEMANTFKDLPDSLRQSVAIAETIELKIEQGVFHFPKSGYDNPQEILAGITQQELLKRGLDSDVYATRLNMELNVINTMGFSEYFLVVKDLVEYAKREGIPVGPGRGSAAGCLVSYLIGITSLDPISHGLLFERFLNASRKSLPDVDIDFCQESRKTVINYLKDKYGDDKVASIITFGRFGPKKAIRQVARVLEVPLKETDTIAKKMNGDTITESIAKDATLVASKSQNPELFRVSEQLEGFVEYAGTHASGIIVCCDPIYEHVPLARQKDGAITTQWDLEECEKVGLVKFDILGLETLTVIRRTEKLIESRHNIKISLESTHHNHPEVYKLLCHGDTEGVFQCYSDGMKRLLLEMQPSHFEDIVSAITLFRPGPLESGLKDQYIRRKHGKEEVTYVHPDCEPIMKDSYGTMIYQEQIMLLASTLAGFTLIEADELRKAVGKKLPDKLAEIQERFVKGCLKTGKVSNAVAKEIWEQIFKYARYGFNKAHAASYAYLTYYTAYLKVFYPLEFFCANLTQEVDNPAKLKDFVVDSRKHGIKIIPPNIVTGSSDFTINTDGDIVMGFGAIKGVPKDIDFSKYLRNVPDLTFADAFMLIPKGIIKKDILEALAMSGAMDPLGIERELIIKSAKTIIVTGGQLEEPPKKTRKKKNATVDNVSTTASVSADSTTSGSNTMGSTVDTDTDSSGDYTVVLERPLSKEAQRLKWEHEAFGFFLSGHPMVKEQLRAYAAGCIPIKTVLNATADKKKVRIAGIVGSFEVKSIKNGPNKGKKYARFTLEDHEDQIVGALFANSYDKLIGIIEESAKTARPIQIFGTLDTSPEEPQIMLIDAKYLENCHSKGEDLKIPIRLDSKYDLDLIKKLALEYPGDKQLVFCIESTKPVLIRTDIKVNEAEFLNNISLIL